MNTQHILICSMYNHYHKIVINPYSDNTILVKQNGKVFYNGTATNIIDSWEKISFIGSDGESYEYLKGGNTTHF